MDRLDGVAVDYAGADAFGSQGADGAQAFVQGDACPDQAVLMVTSRVRKDP